MLCDDANNKVLYTLGKILVMLKRISKIINCHLIIISGEHIPSVLQIILTAISMGTGPNET